MDTRVKIITQIINQIEDQQNVLTVKSLDTQWRNASPNFQISNPRVARDKIIPMKDQTLESKNTASSVKRMATQLTNVMLWRHQKEKLRQQNPESMRSKKAMGTQTTHHPQKLKQDSSDAPRESLNQTTIKSNNPSIQPKPPEDILVDPSIINMIRQMWI